MIWGTKEEDTFPTLFRMNTRSGLKALFEAGGFSEEQFRFLDDPRIFTRWKTATTVELAFWRLVKALHLRYPERNILGVYVRR